MDDVQNELTSKKISFEKGDYADIAPNLNETAEFYY